MFVGDTAYDLQAGRAAGAATVLLDPGGRSPLRAQADWCVRGLHQLLALHAPC